MSKHSDVLKWIIIGLLSFLVLIIVFAAGMRIGGTKARFSYGWAQSYHKNFAGPRKGFLENWRNFPRGDFVSGHGTFGEIIKINEGTLVVKGRGNVEKIILITDKTTIVSGRQEIKLADLKIDEQVVVIGSPNEEGQIESKLIRIFDGEEIKNLQKPFHPFRFLPFFKK